LNNVGSALAVSRFIAVKRCRIGGRKERKRYVGNGAFDNFVILSNANPCPWRKWLRSGVSLVMEKAAGEATIESDGFRKGRDRESAFVQFVDWRSIIL
jgi:hypothetical protein